MTSKQKKGIAAGVATVFATAVLALFGISGDTVIEMDYEIIRNGPKVEMVVHSPEELSIDIVELLCNDQPVTKTVLPDGTLQSLPLVFSNLGNLELRMYKLGEVIGVGKFEGDKLLVAVKDSAIPEGFEVTEETVEAEVAVAGDSQPTEGGN